MNDFLDGFPFVTGHSRRLSKSRGGRPCRVFPISAEAARAKESLERTGYTYHEAADALGVSYGHLAMVLACHRKSKRLLKAISDLEIQKESSLR